MLVVAARQAQAREYVNYLREYWGVIDAGLAISDEDESLARITEFRERRRSTLVTVGMAYEGLDAIGVTHEACLTHIRSKPWIEQMIGRGVRVDPLAGEWKDQYCFVYVPDDELMRACIAEIKEDQAPYILDAKTSDLHGGKLGGTPLNPIIPLDGAVAGFRGSELDGDALSREDTAELQALLECSGLVGVLSPVQTARLLNNSMEFSNTSAPFNGVGLSVAEKRIRVWIQRRCNAIDRERGWKPGETNRRIKTHFRKGREEMTFDELRNVKRWL